MKEASLVLFVALALTVNGQKSQGISDSLFQIELKAAEARHQERMQKLDAKGESNFPFSIQQVRTYDPDPAGGVDMTIIMAYYKKSKTIKYIRFTVMPYNAVGDKVACTIRGYSAFTGNITGPITASAEARIYDWENAWYNSTIDCLKLIKVSVEYMDGTSYTYINELPKILDGLPNDCSYK